MTLTAGQTLSHYTILAPIGAGAMGEVWRAKDTRLGREVAIKVLPDAFASDEERLRRFEREAKTLATVNHPNVAQIFGVDRVGEASFLVLELVPGESLADRLKRGPLPLEEAIDVCRQIAEGLEAAHEAGVIHRDLKPANIRITPEGKVKLLDFGLAKPVRADGDTQDSTDSVLSTEQGRLLGTPTYMAPEQARGKPIDKRVDIWAFGCVLYECLTKKRAFAGATLADVLGAVMHTEPDWKALPANTPPHIRELISRCLTKDPHQRLRDIGDARVLINGPVNSFAIAPRSRKISVVIIALAALLSGSVFTLALMRNRANPPGPGAFRQLNHRIEAIFRAGFAPDGKTVVYSAAARGNVPEIFTVGPNYPEPQSLGLSDTELLSISSQGELAILTGVKVIANGEFFGTLASIPLGGGAPRAILEDVREADWSPDGTQLAIIRDVNGKDRLEYPIGKVLCDASGYLSNLRVSPAGDRVAYFDHPVRWDTRGSIRVIDLQGRITVFEGEYWSEDSIAWSRDGREILFSASEGTSDVTVYAITPEGRRRTAFQAPGGLTIQDVNREGHWLATRDVKTLNLMVRVPGAEQDRDLSWLGLGVKGLLSQDAQTLVFCELAAGPSYAVCARKTDGSHVARLGDGAPYDLSRDGKWVLSIILAPTPKVMLYPTGPGLPKEVAPGNLERFEDAKWFRDGKRILLNAAEPGHAFRYYVHELDSGAARPVTPEGTHTGLLSPDERSILAAGPSGEFFVFQIEGGEPRPAKGLAEQDQLLHWSADGRSVLATHARDVPCRVERVNLDTGERELFRELAPADLAGVIRIGASCFTDDEQAYAYTTSKMASSLFVSEGTGR